MDVLILGNGISRISYDSLIKDWTGEVWGCNRAYLDYPAKLSRLTGHKEVMAAAAKYRDENQHSYKIWSGNLGACPGADHQFTCPKKFQRDSGSTLVAQALREGHTVTVVGFDLGGKDIHSPELENADKTDWVNKWRAILEHYDPDRVRFIGHDHKPFLLSDKPADSYAKFYLHGKAHLTDPEYLTAWKQFTGQTAPTLPWKAGDMVKVKFPNGYEAEMRPVLADLLKKKGEVEIIGKVKEEKVEAPKDKEPKK